MNGFFIFRLYYELTQFDFAMKRYFLFLLACLSGFGILAQQEVDNSYYLPQNVNYDPDIPTPERVIGFNVGEWHVSHDKIVHYMQTLAEASDRITIESRGATYEDRPLLLLTITSPENHKNIEQIRTAHLKLSDVSQSAGQNTADMPLVIYQGFSIHGNEASGANAGLLVAYYLAAGQGDKINEILDNTVILLDPAYNPDGIQRFSTWVNMHKNQQITANSQDREYDEVWPGGRTNHYWFDMNRDWLVTQLPESQARIRSFQHWKPNILTDHHEMGTNSTFFFQPGIPSRTHPLTPPLNQQLTAKIGEYHAKALDKIGSLYFTEERYDDFYYGKGSTYPDINGGIGILFEQASARGHAQETVNGKLTFPFSIRNQFATALSTLEAGVHMREELLNYQRSFYLNAQKEVDKDRNKGIVFGSDKAKGKTYQFAKMLERQHIIYHKLANSVKLDDKTFNPNYSFFIPTNQPNYRMIEAMFETRTSFKDSLFYDVSAWTLPMAFNLPFSYTNSTAAMGEKIENLPFPEGKVEAKSNYAYLFEWNEYYTPQVLYKLLDKGLRVKVAEKKFGFNNKDYGYGTILIPVANQDLETDEIYNLLTGIAKESGVDFYAANTGITTGIDLGSSYFNIVRKPKIAMLIGEGVSSYDAGEIWHLMDTRYKIPITKIDTRNLRRANLDEFTTLIIPNTASFSIKNEIMKLKDFVKNGGTLIGFRNSLKWLDSNKFIDLDFKKPELKAKNVPYVAREDFRGAQGIGGAIFEVKLDLTHPIAYGYRNETMPVFKKNTLFLKPDSTSHYKPPIQYTKKPLLSGYISEENLAIMPDAIPFKATSLSKGKVIVFSDNTNFRAFWYGTNKLLMNAVFFDKMMP